MQLQQVTLWWRGLEQHLDPNTAFIMCNPAAHLAHRSLEFVYSALFDESLARSMQVGGQGNTNTNRHVGARQTRAVGCREDIHKHLGSYHCTQRASAGRHNSFYCSSVIFYLSALVVGRPV